MTASEPLQSDSRKLTGKKGLVIGIANDKSIAWACVKAMHELGTQGIRVHALSPGPIMTRAGSGIQHFDELLAQAAQRASSRHLVTIDDVGAVAAGLVSDWAQHMTGNVVFVDGGYDVLG